MRHAEGVDESQLVALLTSRSRSSLPPVSPCSLTCCHQRSAQARCRARGQAGRSCGRSAHRALVRPRPPPPPRDPGSQASMLEAHKELYCSAKNCICSANASGLASGCSTPAGALLNRLRLHVHHLTANYLRSLHSCVGWSSGEGRRDRTRL